MCKKRVKTKPLKHGKIHTLLSPLQSTFSHSDFHYTIIYPIMLTSYSIFLCGSCNLNMLVTFLDCFSIAIFHPCIELIHFLCLYIPTLKPHKHSHIHVTSLYYLHACFEVSFCEECLYTVKSKQSCRSNFLF